MVSGELYTLIDELCRNRTCLHGEREFLMGAAEKGLNGEQLKLVSNASRTISEMKEVADGFLKGLSMDQVKVYASTNFDAKEMSLLKDGLLNGQPIYYMKDYGQFLLELTSSMYQCALMQFAIEYFKTEKANGINTFDRSSNNEAYRKACGEMKNAVYGLMPEIQDIFREKVNSAISDVISKTTEQKKGIDALISGAERKVEKAILEKDKKEQTPVWCRG